jgi:hypothetical protein
MGSGFVLAKKLGDQGNSRADMVHGLGKRTLIEVVVYEFPELETGRI